MKTGFNEITYVYLPPHCEIMVDIDLETNKPIEIYTYVRDVKDLPESMQPLFTIPSKNSLFIKCNDLTKTYNLVKRHCIRVTNDD